MKESHQERCTVMSSSIRRHAKAEDEQVQESEIEDSESDEDLDT
jgi:hypothetical protein